MLSQVDFAPATQSNDWDNSDSDGSSCDRRAGRSSLDLGGSVDWGEIEHIVRRAPHPVLDGSSAVSSTAPGARKDPAQAGGPAVLADDAFPADIVSASAADRPIVLDSRSEFDSDDFSNHLEVDLPPSGGKMASATAMLSDSEEFDASSPTVPVAPVVASFKPPVVAPYKPPVTQVRNAFGDESFDVTDSEDGDDIGPKASAGNSSIEWP